jgi:hypothetical protein
VNRKPVHDPSCDTSVSVSTARLPPILLTALFTLPLNSQLEAQRHRAGSPRRSPCSADLHSAFPLPLPLPSTQQLHIGTDTRTTSLAPTPMLDFSALRADARGDDPCARRGTRLGRSRRSRDPEAEGPGEELRVVLGSGGGVGTGNIGLEGKEGFLR